ncbi:hypothetical protein ACV28C_004893, partial [Enterobacter asburiae]
LTCSSEKLGVRFIACRKPPGGFPAGCYKYSATPQILYIKTCVYIQLFDATPEKVISSTRFSFPFFTTD